jgi:sugar lactone lactonase YvrE
MKKIYFLTTLFLSFLSQAQTVSTLAGIGTIGSTNSTGTAPSFYKPRGVAVDASGNVYVADTYNHKIRKITSAGVVSTLAGSGEVDSTDGTGTAASFRNPNGVAVDASGNVYVADTNNHKIRKITPSGVVSTLAGSGIQGSTDATGTAASFNYPSGAAVDASGNVYVADSGNHKIRKITPAGVVSTFAGSGRLGSTDATGTAASFDLPFGVAVDASGNVYVSDRENNKIRKITSAGVVSTFAGSGSYSSADGMGIAASFKYPARLAVDASGNVYVADNGNHKIRKITPAGVVSTLAGDGTEGSTDATGTAASFHDPEGVAVDASGNVFVADRENNKIRKITSAGVVSTFAGSGEVGSNDATATAPSFYNPSGVALDASGNVYVADSKNNKIRKITSAGVVSTFAGSGEEGRTDATGTAASFNRPFGVALDASGNVYVADSKNNKIRKITPAGVVSTFAGSGEEGRTDATGTAASFNRPFGVALDASGNVYVADYINDKIRKITPAGEVSTFAGSGYSGSTDGTGTAASFYSPTGVAVDASGNVYVADTSNNKIRKITPSGVVSTLAGSGAQGSTDGTGTAASFYRPVGAAVDAAGNVYVADTYNDKIRKITSAGVVSTFAGSGDFGSTDGTGTAASFKFPQGVAVDASGNVYVADTYNHKIRKITSAGVVSTLAGSGEVDSTDGTGTAASFNGPGGVALDAAGNVYVADRGNNKIRKITSAALSSANYTFTNLVGYPNPAKNTFTIAIQENATATVYNLLGKAVVSKTLISGENTIDTAKLTNGVYIVTIQNENGAQSIKLVKE